MINKKTQLDFDYCKELLYQIAQEKLNVSKEELLSKKKTRPLADTRRAMIRILKTKFPYAKVVVLGEAVSRDHSSVSIQLKKHEELISYNNDYSSLFNVIGDEFYKVSPENNQTLEELYEIKNSLEEKLKTVILIIHELENKKKSQTICQ
jgi:hypothetical protein